MQGSLRLRFASVASLAAAFALGGCATVAPASAPPAGEPQSGSASAQTSRAAPAPSKAAFRAAEIAGKAAADLDALLGEPALTRIEGKGEYRRYALAECALLVILLPNEKGERRVAHLDAGALVAGAEKPDLDRCLARGLAEPA